MEVGWVHHLSQEKWRCIWEGGDHPRANNFDAFVFTEVHPWD